MSKVYIGIDIGNEGYIHAISDGKLANHIPMPNVTKAGRKTADRSLIKSFIEVQDNQKRNDVVVVIEAASKHLQSQLAASSMWFGYMAIICACEDAGCRYVLTPAKTWQKEFGISKDTKNQSIATAKSLFPDVDLRRTERSKKMDDNKSDSILLAEYGRRKNL